MPLSRMASKEPSLNCGRLLQQAFGVVWGGAGYRGDAAQRDIVREGVESSTVSCCIQHACRTRLRVPGHRNETQAAAPDAPGVCHPVLELWYVAVRLLQVLDGDRGDVDGQDALVAALLHHVGLQQRHANAQLQESAGKRCCCRWWLWRESVMWQSACVDRVWGVGADITHTATGESARRIWTHLQD